MSHLAAFARRLALGCTAGLLALASLACTAPRAPIEGPLPRPGGHAIDRSEQEFIPLLRIEPQYPAAARTQRKQGYVIVEFSLSEEGDVVDARVILAKPTGLFTTSALEAVRRWKFEPQLVDGKPSRREGLRVRLDYKLRGL